MRVAAVVGASLLAGFVAACAQGGADAGFPNRPVRIVVPFPAGGTTDVNIRILGQKLSDIWGQAVVIENRPGANTGIGAQMVATAPADGYTLLAAMDTTLVMNPATGASMAYDPFTDFAPITLTSKNTSLLVVRASDGPKTIQELIARGKASQNKLNYGAGITITRLAGASFARAAGIDVVLVPYKGSSEVVLGLLTGSVDFIVDGLASSLPLVKSGQFRALAKLNDRPLALLPELQPLSVAANLPQLDACRRRSTTRRRGRRWRSTSPSTSPSRGSRCMPPPFTRDCTSRASLSRPRSRRTCLRGAPSNGSS